MPHITALSLYCCIQISLAEALLPGAWILQEWTIGNARQSLIQNAAVGMTIKFDGKKIIFGSNANNNCKYKVVPYPELAIDLIGDKEEEKSMGIVIPDRNGIRLVFPIEAKGARPTKRDYEQAPKKHWSIYLTRAK